MAVIFILKLSCPGLAVFICECDRLRENTDNYVPGTGLITVFNYLMSLTYNIVQKCLDVYNYCKSTFYN